MIKISTLNNKIIPYHEKVISKYQDILSIFPQEFLDIKIKTPTLNDEIDNVFSVIKINKYSDVNQGAKLFEFQESKLIHIQIIKNFANFHNN